MAEDCAGGGEEECPPVIVSWEGSADIQIGDILIVRISDSLLDSIGQQLERNTTLDANASHGDKDRLVFSKVAFLCMIVLCILIRLRYTNRPMMVECKSLSKALVTFVWNC